MIEYLKKFERMVTGVLLVMLALVIILAVIDLGWLLVQDIFKPPILILDVGDLLEIFGFFLLVLIGLELKVVFTVALIALGRKIIVLEPDKYSGLTLIGIGAIILALVAGYFVVSISGLEFRRSWMKPEKSGDVIWA